MDKTEIKTKLKDFISRELLGNPNYQIEDQEPLITGGLIDSFSLAQIGVFVEDAFDVYIPDTDLTVANMDTLEQMVTRIMIDLNS
jgi:acyl carrier protein